jgi:hypothetical protein
VSNKKGRIVFQGFMHALYGSSKKVEVFGIYYAFRFSYKLKIFRQLKGFEVQYEKLRTRGFIVLLKLSA